MKRIIKALTFCFCFPSILIVGLGGNALSDQIENPGAGKGLYRSEDLLQFRQDSHTIGFAPQRMYIVGRDYCLIESFAGTEGVTPIRKKEEQVSYPDLWPGIHLRYETKGNSIAESFYQIEPGADVRDIRLTYNREVEIRSDGSLAFTFAEKRGWFTMSPPRAWQNVAGKKVSVAVTYDKHNDQTIGFEVSSYDRTLPLIIDPVYQWHTFYGSASDDYAYDIAVDGNGNVYVTGFSTATWNSNTNGLSISPKHSFSGSYDIAVIKLNSMGIYQWHTFYGSADFDQGNGIAIDAAGNIYVTGRSIATWNGPGLILPPLPKHGHSGGQDLVILKLNSDGEYQWHTFYGSADYDEAFTIATDTNGDVYAAGSSNNGWAGPTGQVPLNDYSNDFDTVILKLSSNGEYQWHTFYGSDSYDSAEALAVDGSGNVYVTGISYYIWFGPSFTLPENTFSGNTDIFALKLNSNGAYQWHTFHGSDALGFDSGSDITLDRNNNIYIAGYSDTTWNGPSGENPKNGHTGNRDILVLKLNNHGDYQFHTFYGSTDSFNDVATGITTDERGRLFISGRTNATWDGPEGEKPLNNYSGDGDVVILSLTNSGSYQWHSFFGSAVRDGCTGIALDERGNIHVTGYSDAAWTGPEGITPINNYNGNVDMLILKMTASNFPWTLFRPALDNGKQEP